MNLRYLMHRIFTTHTLGGIKFWKGGHNYPFKKIFFQYRCFYSNKFRKANHLCEKNEMMRKMPHAKEMGLDNYIFAYLGLHEHYYSTSDGFNVPPFGIFFSKNLDTHGKTNVSKYDFASPFVSTNNFYKNPFQARDDAVVRINNEFFGDFFNYWVCPNYEQKGFYDSEAWKWKIEFHYFEKVEIYEVEAILWPIIYIASLSSVKAEVAIYKPDPEYENPRKDFMADKRNASIKIYPFVWDADTSIQRFSYASYLITKYYHDNYRYPDVNLFQEQFNFKFPKI